MCSRHVLKLTDGRDAAAGTVPSTEQRVLPHRGGSASGAGAEGRQLEEPPPRCRSNLPPAHPSLHFTSGHVHIRVLSLYALPRL